MPQDEPAAAAAVRPAALSVGTRVVKGTKSTGRDVPKTFKYTVKVPTLQGADAKAKKAFDKKIDSLVAAELTYYAKAALTEDQAIAIKTQWGSDMSAAKWLEFCHENFKDLTGKFTSSVYRGQYASVVVTFSGIDAPCVGLGGLWVEYRTDRSVTIDTKTGTFKSLTDFTSNTSGEVTAGVKAWYAKESHEFWAKRPTVTKTLKVCDRPGNVITLSTAHKACYPQPSAKSGPVAWLVQDKGLRLSFPAGEGVRHATIAWTKIPQLL
jgi:hypothetical protein